MSSRVLLVLLFTGLVYGFGPTHVSNSAGAQTQPKSRKKSVPVVARYSCPMHPEVKSSKRGRCPKCGMALRLSPNEVAEVTAPAPEITTADPSEASSITSLRIPDVAVYDQTGKVINFYRDLVKGKTVAINFIFTTCTTICPPLTATFRRVQQNLAEGPLEVQLISISVDPAIDTPDRLLQFAAKFKAGPGWTFVTGDKTQIDSLLREFGVAVANKNDHTPMILIGNDRAGYWTRAYGLSSPTALVKLITEAASRK
jgi:cytochrome oxidase Cu insertion factor (SCO1/SenC/PrrC family)